MNKKTTPQGRLPIGIALTLLTTAMITPMSSAFAGDEITAEVLADMQLEAMDSVDHQNLFTAVQTGLLVVSERLSRVDEAGRGIMILKQEQTATGDALPMPKYYERVGIPNADPSSQDTTLFFFAEVPSEHVLRMKRERNPDTGFVTFLKVYSQGMMAVGAVVDKGIADSVFRGSGATDLDELLITDPPGHACDYISPSGNAAVEASLPSDIDDTRRINYNRSQFGGIQFKFFSAQLFLFGPACMLRSMANRIDDYEGDDPEGEALRVLQDMDLGVLESAIFEGFTQQESTSAVPRTDSNVDTMQAGAGSSMPGGLSTLARWTTGLLMNTAHADIAPPMPQGPTTYGTWTIPNFNSTQIAEDGTKTTINTMTVTMDMDWFVIVKQRSEGTIESEGQVRDFYMEHELSDFRYVLDTVLYEPHKQVIRMGGMLSPEDRAQMQEAKEKLAEFERQMASMPKSQRAMMESMMGSKMDEFRKLADDGTFEMELITTGWVLNPHLSDESVDTVSPFAHANIVKIVQEHLVTLGYDPGNTTGELTKQTVIAITKYEAASGMPVTGEATIELMNALRDSVGAGQ